MTRRNSGCRTSHASGSPLSDRRHQRPLPTVAVRAARDEVPRDGCGRAARPGHRSATQLPGRLRDLPRDRIPTRPEQRTGDARGRGGSSRSGQSGPASQLQRRPAEGLSRPATAVARGGPAAAQHRPEDAAAIPSPRSRVPLCLQSRRNEAFGVLPGCARPLRAGPPREGRAGRCLQSGRRSDAGSHHRGRPRAARERTSLPQPGRPAPLRWTWPITRDGSGRASPPRPAGE